jgi:hypothetical protein
MSAFNIQPQDVIDLGSLEKGIHDRKKVEDRAKKLFRVEFQRAFNSLAVADYEQSASYIRNAFAFLEGAVPKNEWAKLVAEVAKDKTLVDRVRDDYYLKGVKYGSPEEAQILSEAFSKLQRKSE